MATLSTQYQNYLKDNNLLMEHVTYDYWLDNIFIPFISDDFQIGPDGAYEHNTEEENVIVKSKSKTKLNHMETKPDKWVVLQIGNLGPIYKVFASWAGGYVDGDYWRINSGIVRVEEVDESYNFIGYSGSVYVCRKTTYGIATSYSENVLNTIIARGVENNIPVTIMPIDTDWLHLINR